MAMSGGTAPLGPTDIWNNLTEALRSEEWHKVKTLFLMVALEFAGFAILIPVLPFFMIEELGFSPTQVGTVLAAFAAAQMIGAAIMGRLSDAYGRRPLTLFGFGWVFVGCTATAFCTTFTHLLIVRAMQGLSGGTMALCHSYLLDAVPMPKQPQWFGIFGGGVSVSFVLGPMIGAGLSAAGVDRRAIFIVAGCLALVGTIFGAVYLEESLPPEKRRPVCGARDGTPRWQGEVVNTGLVAVWVVRFLTAGAQGFLYATYAFLIGDLFEWSDVHFGIILFASGALGGLTQMVIFPALASAFGVPACLLTGTLSGIIAYALYPQPLVAIHAVAIFFFAMAGALSEPAIPVLVGKYAGPLHLGFGNGVAGAARGLGVVVAPLVAAAIYERSPAMTYYTGACVYACAAMLTGVLVFSSEPPAESGEKKALLEKP